MMQRIMILVWCVATYTCAIGQDTSVLNIKVKKLAQSSETALIIDGGAITDKLMTTRRKIQLSSRAKDTLNVTLNPLRSGDYFTILLKNEYPVSSYSMIVIQPNTNSITQIRGDSSISPHSLQLVDKLLRIKGTKILLENFVLVNPDTQKKFTIEKMVTLTY